MKLIKKREPFLDSLQKINVDAEHFEIIETTSEFRVKLFQYIKNAKKRIYITALYLQDDAAGQAVLREIYQAKQKNPHLDVKIFVDFLRAQRGLMGHEKSIGNVRLYRELSKEFEHQIDILGVPVKSKEVLGVLHLKGFVFDDSLLYSGASINNIYLQESERYRYDRYHIINNIEVCNSFVEFLQSFLVKSPAVKNLTQENIPNKKQLKPSISKLKRSLRVGNYLFKSTQSELTDNQISITPLLGFGGRKNQLNRTIFEMIRTAESSVTIYTPYFNFPSLINRIVRKILKRGKNVNIVVGDKTANDFFIPTDEPFNRIGIVPYVYEANLRSFLKRNQKFVNSKNLNIYLWKHENNSYHLKGVNKDNNCYLLTGHNLNSRASRLDLENGILIQDPQQLLKEKFASELQVIQKHTKRINHFDEIETINDYPEEASKLMRTVKRAKLDSILNRLL